MKQLFLSVMRYRNWNQSQQRLWQRVEKHKSLRKRNMVKSDLRKNKTITTRMGFEPTRAEHIGLAVQRLNHSATSSDEEVSKNNLFWSQCFNQYHPFCHILVVHHWCNSSCLTIKTWMKNCFKYRDRRLPIFFQYCTNEFNRKMQREPFMISCSAFLGTPFSPASRLLCIFTYHQGECQSGHSVLQFEILYLMY